MNPSNVPLGDDPVQTQRRSTFSTTGASHIKAVLAMIHFCPTCFDAEILFTLSKKTNAVFITLREKEG